MSSALALDAGCASCLS